MQFERRTITQTIKVPTNTGRTVDEHTKAYLNRAMDVMDSMGIGMWPAIVSASQLGADDELQEILGDAMVGDGYSRNGFIRLDETDIPDRLLAWRDAAVKAALEDVGVSGPEEAEGDGPTDSQRRTREKAAAMLANYDDGLRGLGAEFHKAQAAKANA